MTSPRKHMAEPFSQGRIRLNEEGALELEEALIRHEHYLLDVRDEVGAAKDVRKVLNRRVTTIRRVQAELERLLNEQGWSQEDQGIGQLQRPDAQGTSGGVPADPAQQLGRRD